MAVPSVGPLGIRRRHRALRSVGTARQHDSNQPVIPSGKGHVMQHAVRSHIIGPVVAACVALFAPITQARDSGGEGTLEQAITRLDGQVFDAYNRCDLNTFASYFAPDVEFYHDTGGASFDRQTVVDNTRKYICHKVRRELIPASFKIYPIKGFGAIEEGEHRFCQIASGQCEGVARFLMIWRHRDHQWQLVRVVSYGHRALTDAEKAAFAPPARQDAPRADVASEEGA